jgi:hypothetical protein
MSAWPQEELCRMAESDDLHVAPFRGDGRTYGTPIWIWSVVVDGTSTCVPITVPDRVGTELR